MTILPKSIRLRILLIVLLSIVPVLAITTYSGLTQHRSARRAAEREAQDVAAGVAGRFQQELERTGYLLRFLSGVPAIRNLNAALSHAVLARAAASSPGGLDLTLFLPSGAELAAASAARSLPSASGRIWFKEVALTRTMTVSGFSISPDSREPALVLAVPLVDDRGDLRAVVAASVGLGLMERSLLEYSLPSASTILVLDNTGTVLVRYPESTARPGQQVLASPFVQTMRRGNKGSLEAPGIDGQVRLYGFTSVRFAGRSFLISVGIPTTIAFAQATRSIAFSAIILILYLALAFLGAWFFGNTLIADPVRRIRATAARLADGDLTVRSDVPHSLGEFGQIAQAVDSVAESLQKRVAEREHESVERRLAEDHYRTLFGSMAESLLMVKIVYDESSNPVDFQILDLNPAFERLAGLKAGEIVGRLASQSMNGTNAAEWIPRLAEVARTGKRLEIPDLVGSRGNHLHLICYSPQPGYCALLVSDTTEQTVMAERLRQQLHWMTVLNSISTAIAEKNTLESTLRVITKHVEENFHIQAGWIELSEGGSSRNIVAIVSVRGRERVAAVGVEEGREAPEDLEELISAQRNQDEALVYDLPGSLALDSSGAASAFFEKLASAGFSELVVVPFAAGRLRLGAIFLLFEKPVPLTDYERSFLSGLAKAEAIAVENRNLYAEIEDSYVKLKQTQSVMMEQERLNAMGQMASGIAHDINNTLAPIMLYTEALIEGEPNVSERARRFLHTIHDAARDIEGTTQRLRSFYRRIDDGTTLESIDFDSLFSEIVELTRPRWQDIAQRSGITIEIALNIDEDLPLFAGNASELREALVNLVFNATDALPQGGKIVLSAIRQNSHVVIGVSDSGVGMTEEQKRRCLEPFYTTKGARGTGLGLSTVFGVVQRHGGSLKIDSTLGKGTSVWMHLPTRVEPAAPRPSVVSVKPVRSLRILCIDDDVLVRQALADILEMDGHTVVTADGGVEGIELFTARMAGESPIDIVITDLGMPHMDGWQVARGIKDRSARTPVILLSGWGSFIRDEIESSDDVDCVLAKPPQIDRLRRVLLELAEKVDAGGAK